jgi:hypothetical protein
MTLTIVETRAVTGGVDTHADVHVAAALDPIGGLLGVASSRQPRPATPAFLAGWAGSAPSAWSGSRGPALWRRPARNLVSNGSPWAAADVGMAMSRRRCREWARVSHLGAERYLPTCRATMAFWWAVWAAG